MQGKWCGNAPVGCPWVGAGEWVGAGPVWILSYDQMRAKVTWVRATNLTLWGRCSRGERSLSGTLHGIVGFTFGRVNFREHHDG